MDLTTRAALAHVQEAIRIFTTWDAGIEMTEAAARAAVYDPPRWAALVKARDAARKESFPIALAHLAIASNSLDGDWKKGTQAFESMIRTQERMWQLADRVEDHDSRQWKTEYQDCVKRNRRYGSDVDKHFLRAAQRAGIPFDENGIHLEESEA